MRFKAALIIIAIVLVITAVNFGSSLILMRNTLNVTMSEDLSIALDIANNSVSMRIRLYKSSAQTAAGILLARIDNHEDMETIMQEVLAEFSDFIGFAMFDRQGVLSEYGDTATSVILFKNSEYARRAFDGQTVISTTRYNAATEKMVMHICTPMGNDKILSVTISGMIFAELLGNYILRDIRLIFMLDEQGTVIAHLLPEFVTSRANFADYSADLLNEMLMNERGTGNYFADGIEYQCAYAKVMTPETDWRIGLSVPVSENLVVKLQNRLFILALIFFSVGVIAALICSGFIARPYNKIAEQNSRLEALNEITRSQTEKIMEAHQVTKLMMDATPICSMLWDRKNGLFDCNEETLKTFGIQDKQEFLDNFFSFSPEYQSDGQSSRDLTMELINRTFEEERVSSQWMHQLMDGTPVPCEMTFVRISNDADYIVAAYARDLREHRRMTGETHRLQIELEAALKEAQEANRAKTSFLANMSHEMRTPLNAVIGLSELILNEGELSRQTTFEPQVQPPVMWDEIEDKLGKIHNSGMTLLGIVNDILDISKIESGRFELHPVIYNTSSLINDIVSLNIVRIGEKPIKFILTVNENLPEQLLGDDLRVRQIFNNLLSNAFKYTNSGTVELKMTFEREDNNIWLVSDIKDTGMGIRSEDIEKVFEDYIQVNAQANRKIESTGLGLSITRHLADMMDGNITVESEYDKGSTFSIRLRQRLVSDIPIGKETVENLMSARFTDNKRIQSSKLKRINLSYASVLVVDDMPANLDVAKGMMKPYGLRVDCASSGRQAIDMISNAANIHYDAVFMDHMMPGMDGIEAVRIIREELDTDYARNVPIIALTANAIMGNEDMFLEHGFQAFISKPIDTQRLDSILRQWVRNEESELQTKLSADGELSGEAVSGENGIGIKSGSHDFMVELNEPFNDAPGGTAIAGVDMAAGLKRFSGNVEEYMKVLKSYAVNTRPLLSDIKKHLSDGTLDAYAISVHGIKGASYGIGAFDAGLNAETLERLAKAGKMEQVAAGNSAFIEIMTNLLDSIDSALDLYTAKNKKPVKAEPDQKLLQELQEACDEYDAGRIDRIMAQLQSFEYENGAELVAWLNEQIDDMNFSRISIGNWPVFK
ncbi:MAG: ATP-binding protein [Treponema sp.]|nr:ATP-binding protein [Treponema sp.]